MYHTLKVCQGCPHVLHWLGLWLALAGVVGGSGLAGVQGGTSWLGSRVALRGWVYCSRWPSRLI
jgi:hypothetical protein